MKTRAIVAVATTIAALVLPAVAAHAAFPGQNGKIAFVGFEFNPDPVGAIYVIQPDGSGLAKLGPERDPAWSPDGGRIAVAGAGITIYNLDGSVAAQVPTPEYAADPHWSPDGQRLVFTVDPIDGAGDIWVVNVDGTGLTNITDSPEHDFDPAWSPDGASIAFIHAPAFAGESRLYTDVYTMKPDGSGQVQLTFDAERTEAPSWSPDGTRIAFTTFTLFGPGPTLIEIFNRDGSGRAPLGAGREPAWSPDGSKVAFQCAGELRICTMNLDGSERFVIPTGLESFTPDWQPLPQSPDGFQNASKFCKAERERLGAQSFRDRYGGNRSGANAHGKCVQEAKGK